MNIRPAITTDITLLQAIGKQTFYETFADTNTPEDMEQYLTTSFATSKVQQELSNPDSLFFFAEEENKVIGYLKLNFASAQTERQDPNAMEIEISLLPHICLCGLYLGTIFCHLLMTKLI